MLSFEWQTYYFHEVCILSSNLYTHMHTHYTNEQHHMISKGEIDAYGFTEHYFTLAHKAAMHGRLGVLKFLIKEGNLPLLALQEPDESLTTPAMLAIQVCPILIPHIKPLNHDRL